MTTAPAALACAALCAATALAPAPVRAQDAPVHDGLHDFDFLMGQWHAHLRKRLHPLTGSTQWIEYEGTSVMTKIWDGRANMEEFKVASIPRDAQAAAAAKRPAIDAQTLRLYDPATGLWSIWLADAAHGKLSGPPTVGSFHDGRGEFLDAEDFDGRPIVVRYVWTRPTPTTARMEQSFSPDWGRTWEVNWICDLTPQT
ncbi:MAG TPA: hypothetical protein VES00_01370 [Burkholderiaceae bacterium]|nr:hypothetical protein [Burkholderiaceae bacterium]